MKSPSAFQKRFDSPSQSPLKAKLSSAITPTLGDSMLIANFESQEKIRIELTNRQFLNKIGIENNSQIIKISSPFEETERMAKIKKLPSSESMNLPNQVLVDDRRKSNNFFSSELTTQKDLSLPKTQGFQDVSWKTQLRNTFQQIELSLYAIMTMESGTQRFSRLMERVCRRLKSKKPPKSPRSSSMMVKPPSVAGEKTGGENIVDVLINRHIVFLGDQRHIFQTSHSWLKAILSIVIDFLQAILSLISCVLYILSTYVSSGDYENAQILNFIHKCDYVITALFTADLLRHFVESKNKIRFALSIHSIIDFLAILPIYLQLITQGGSSALGFLHILQIFRLIRILRLYRLFKEYEVEGSDKIDNSLNDSRFSLQKQIAIFICTIFALLFISAGFSYELDQILNGTTYTITKVNDQGNLISYDDLYTFFYAFYLMFQTMFSLGYGDVTASHSSSRILLSILVLLFLFMLVDQILKLFEIKSKTSPWDYEYKHEDHIIILGMFNENSLLRILQELFKLEEEQKIKFVLLLRSVPPSMEIINLMENPLYDGKVSYLQCSLLSETMFTKSKMKKARAIYLVNESPSTSSYQQDKMLMTLMNLIQDCFPFTRKSLRVSDPDIAKRYFGYLNHWTPWNKVFSTIAIKNILMTESIFNQGFSTIFSNFFCSNRLLSMQKSLININWYMEYGASLLQEMFCVPISSFFHGRPFNQVVQMLSKSKSRLNSEGLLLIGVRTKYSNEEFDTRTTILLNPQDYLIKVDDLGIVIATNLERAEYLTFFDLEVLNMDSCSFLDDENIPGTRKESIAKEFELTNTIINDYSIGRFLSKEILLWKEDISEKISGQIILFYAENIYENTIAVLRSKTNKPILYYSENKADDRWTRTAAKYPNIFYVQGDIFDIVHLKNCGIKKAFHVCIFNPMTTPPAESNTPECLLLANMLDEYFSVPYTIEANDQNELKFLTNKPKKFITELGVQFYPKYMAGEAYILSVLDTLLPFSSFNPIALDVFVHMFIYNENRRHSNEQEGEGEWETQNQNLNIFENLQIRTIRCPEAYHSKCYQDLLIDFCSLKPSLIPLGIITDRYTQKKLDRKSTIKKMNYNVSNNFFQWQQVQSVQDELNQNALPSPLTLTNPLPTAILTEGDRIIVIGNFNQKDKVDSSGSSGIENQEERLEEKESGSDDEEKNKKLLTLLNVTLAGRKKTIKKIEEKNQMIKNLLDEIEKKKAGYTKLMNLKKL